MSIHATAGAGDRDRDSDAIITKLVAKVSEQALELKDLTTQLERTNHTGSSGYAERWHDSISSYNSKPSHWSPPSESLEQATRRHSFEPIQLDDSKAQSLSVSRHVPHHASAQRHNTSHSLSLSEAAVQRKHDQEVNQQLFSLQTQLEASESRLADALKARKTMLSELETKSRELKFYARKCKELEGENNLLRSQNESILKMQSISALKSSERKGGVRNSVLKAIDPVVYYKTCDDLAFHKKLVEELQVEIEKMRDEDRQSLMKMRLLEEALEFRSEEIGLAGHSDLLSKVVKLRHEVTSLKSELSEKHGAVQAAEEGKTDYKQQHELLQRQVLQIQARLSKSQQELYSLQNTDVHEQLKKAEDERDKLLEFVSSDMKKSADLSKQIENMEGQLRSSRTNEKALEVNVERLSKLLNEERHRSSEAEDRCNALSGQLQDLSRSHRVAEVERDQLARQLELRLLELEELNKACLSMHSQSKSKEQELNTRTNENNSLKNKLLEYEIVVPRLESDNKQLLDRCRSSDSEVHLLRENLGIFESKVQRLEPELHLLRSEREDVLKEKYSMESELAKLRPLGRILVEMSKDIAQMNEVSGGSSSGDVLMSRESGGGEAGSQAVPVPVPVPVPLSQQHSLWVGLPSIRALHGGLYENIRRLARDLHDKEAQLRDTAERYHSLQGEYRRVKVDHDHMTEQLSAISRESSQTIQQLSERNIRSEHELAALRGLPEIIAQIRAAILASYPSDLRQLSARALIDIDAHHAVDGPIHETKASELSSMHVKSPDQNAKASNQDYLARDVDDRALPDLIGKIITRSSNALVETEALQDKIAELRQVASEWQQQCDELSKGKQDAMQSSSAMASLLSKTEERLQLVQKECADKVTVAVDLAEKQNALTMSLEAKIERLHRDRTVTAAQLTALQQKEASIRHKLLLALQDYCSKVGIDSPPDSCQIIDLLHYASDILRRMAMQQRSFPSAYSPSATIVPLTRPSFSAHHHQVVIPPMDELDAAASRRPQTAASRSKHAPYPESNLESSHRRSSLSSSSIGRYSSPNPRSDPASRQQALQSRSYQLDPTPVSSAADNPSTSRSATSPYKSIATSRNPISSALQDRLYQAQQAFAAMKEAHPS